MVQTNSLAQPHPNDFFFHAAKWIAWCLPLLLFISRTTADLALVTVGCLFLYHSIQQNNWAWLRLSWLKWFYLFLAYLLLINVPNSLDFKESFTYSLFFIRWPLFAVAMSTWVLVEKDNQRHFLMVLIGLICLIMLDTWYQYWLGHDLFGYTPLIGEADFKRLTGPFSKPLVGIMLVRTLFLCLFAHVVFQTLATKQRYFWFTVTLILVGMLTILISGERMALILCISGFGVVMIGFWLQLNNMRLVILLGATLLIVFIGLMGSTMPVLYDRMYENAIDKIMHFSSSDYGVVFNGAWQAWQENFWLGGGLHTYQQHCQAMFPVDFNCTHAHHLYLHLGSETGLIGVSLFSAMIISIYCTAIKPHLKQKNWLLATLSFTILSLSFWPLIGGISLLNNWIAPLAWLGVAWVLIIAQQATKAPH